MHPTKQVFFNKETQINVIKNSLSPTNFNFTEVQNLNLLLELQVYNSSASTKELLVQVTDESDPLLLLSILISESVYQNLRTSQGLLVDFHSFPHHFSNLIKKCLEEHQKESPKFILVVRMTGSEIPDSDDASINKISLEVVELNAFKHLCHLSLILSPASMQSKLIHLSGCIKTLKANLCEERSSSGENNNRCQSESALLQQKLASIETLAKTKTEELRTQLAQERERGEAAIAREKDNIIKMKSDWDRRAARERREAECRFEQEATQRKATNDSLRKSNAELASKVEWMGKDLREYKHRLKASEELSKRQASELEVVARERRQWRQDADLTHEEVRKMKCELAKQERELDELKEMNKHKSTHLDKITSEKANLEEKFVFCRTKLEKREESLRKMFLDFQKSLDIIKKFKIRIKDGEDEVFTLGEKCNLLDRTLRESENNLKEARAAEEAARAKSRLLETEAEALREKLRTQEEKTTRQENELKRNQNVITWLNKQLNEAEATGAVLKGVPPVAEAYLPRGSSLGQTPVTFSGALSHSTPLSNAPNYSANSAKYIHSLGALPPFKDIPNIPEEMKEAENKENSDGIGLDAKYLVPSKGPIAPLKGLIRGTALNKNTKSVASKGNPPTANFRGRTNTKSSGYLPKT